MDMFSTIPADPAEVEKFAESLTPEYLMCRVWHHSPEPHDIKLADKDDKAKSDGAMWSAVLRCRNGCGVRWRVVVDGEGFVVRRRLDYSGAPDYVLKGKGRINTKEGNAVMRRTFFTNNGPHRGRSKARA
jgi:hypothetical protein